MKNRIMCVFLAAVMLLGMVPTFAMPQALAAEGTPESVVIDFKDSAVKASEQDFWADLKDSTGTVGGKYTTKHIGYQGRAGMDATQKAAYYSLIDYLWENHGWTINEETSFLTTYQVNKGVWLNANEMPETSDWGMTYQSGGFNTAPDLAANGSRLNLSVHVEEAGYYAVNVTAYYSTNAGNLAQYTSCGTTAVGGAYADVLVNGVSVLPEGTDSYAFSGHTGTPHAAWGNTTQTDRIGYAYFNAGTNNITFNTTGNYLNVTNTAAMRRNISLKSMELVYIGSEACNCEEFSYTSNGDGTHVAVCDSCGAETTEDCTDENGDRICDLCEYNAAADAIKLNVSVPGVEKQVARNTVQEFAYDITVDGQALLPEDADLRYETDEEGIIEIDEDAHTFRTLQNGDVTVTVTLSVDGVEVSKQLELTVADVGEERFVLTDTTFEDAGALAHWATYPTWGNKLFNFTTVEDDGTGNKALKLTTNSNTSYGAGTIGSVIVMNNGYLAQLQPGHMYEMSARVKVGDYKKPEGAAGDMGIGFQMFDYRTNATSSYLGKINGNCGGVSMDTTEWTEVRFVVKVPLDTEDPVYVTPRIVLRPNETTADKNVTGWEASVWFDDFSIREVGFEGVELELSGGLKSTTKTADVIIKPYATSGDYIDIAAASYGDMVSFTSGNEDVLKIVNAPVRTRYTAASQEYFPKAKVQRLDTENETELVAKVTIYGVTQEARMDVKKVDLSEIVLDTMDVTVPGVVKQVARNTVQKLEFELTDTDGEEIPVSKTAVSYETDVEGIIEIDETAHTFRTLQNGEVAVTITVTLNGKSLSKTLELTVADVGENCFFFTDPTFETEGVIDHWATYANYGDKRFNITTVEDDGTGNKSLKLTTNPNVSMDDVSNVAAIITMANGHFAQILPGHMYEMSFKVKTEDYKKAEDATEDMGFDCQLFDYATNAQIGSNLLLTVNGIQNGIALDLGEWTELRYVVKAPLEAEGPVYIMPRIVLRPKEADYGVSGWEMTAWLDDFSVREVGFERVELEIDSELKDTVTSANVFIKSYATNGGHIEIAESKVADVVSFTSTNEDVVAVVTSPKREVYNSTTREYHPKAGVRLVGLNGQADLVASVTIHGVTQEARMDMTRTDMPEILRDISFTLNGFESLVLKNGDVAKAAMTGRTTQLAPLTEEHLRKGSVYFTSSNTDVAVVDRVTGDVTCVGEGTTTITAYVLKDSVTASDSVTLTVTDETDLASVDIVAAVSYVGVNNTVQLSVTGKKASGGAADMSKYPVAWTVDQEAVALISQSGRLTGLMPGTVNVTATVGVMRTAITDTVTIEVVPNTDLAGSDVVLDFTDGHLMNIHECTIENDGVQINRTETYNNGQDAKTIHKYGFGFNVPVGEQLAIDFIVARDGWYRVEAGGGLFSAGNISDVYVDDYYAGAIDFCAGKSGYPYSAKMVGNTIYLEAGQHTFYVVAATKGVQYLGKLMLRASSDPNPVSVEVSTSKDAILVGESMELIVNVTDAAGKTFSLKSLEKENGKTNYCIASTADPETAAVSGNTITGIKAGYAAVDVMVEINGETSYHTAAFAVEDGTVASAELRAERTTLMPDGGSEHLQIVCYDVAGNELGVPANVSVSYASSDTDIVTVSADGTVVAGSKEGSAKITAIIVEGGHQVEAAVWFTITTGKTAPTLYTYEERAIAQENVLKYDWAWRTKKETTKLADYVIENFEIYYNSLDREGAVPRTSAMYREGYNGAKDCDYCGTEIEAIYGVNCWIVDPIENPWKVTCPQCKRDFPSNDFEAYYKSGLDENGYFDAQLADKSLLVNTTFPDKPADWGVDDGSGWLTGDKDSGGVADVYNYIAYYSHMRFRPRGKAINGLLDGLEALANAYLYTGDEKYGSAGAILLSRVAQIYPEYDMKNSPSGLYVNSDGGNGLGKFTGSIWEAAYVGPLLARAADALWPALNNADAIEYLRNDAAFYGVDPETITPEYLRNEVDEGILLQIRDAVLTTNSAGNFGMEQGSMALAAVALDRLPESEEMIDWVFRFGERMTIPEPHATGGNVRYNLVNLVDRNGFGNEVSYTYNRQWYTNLMGVADALAGYERVEGADLWTFPKFVDMLRAYGRVIQGGHLIVQFGEAGGVQSTTTIINLDVNSFFIPAFQNTGDPFLAQMIYAGNGNSVNGLHGDIFSKNPEEGLRAQIQSVINTYGELDMSASNQLAGFGVTNLRSGPSKYLGANVNGDDFFNTSIYYGLTDASHGHLESLSLNLFAYGLSMSANLGYPTIVSSSSFERTQWIRNTISHNTVVVDDQAQLGLTYGGFPLHYDDADQVQMVDVQASNAYAMTDIYRRTVVTVKAPNGVPYNVDFFRILGGKEHVYSFHANTSRDPATEGLDLTHQPMGSYAGADVPYGPYYHHSTSTDGPYNQGNGYSWLKNVYRDAAPEKNFTVDWAIQDFHNQLSTSTGIHMSLTMLSEEPMTEVALADGVPPQNGTNPEKLKYVLVRKSGNSGMDTLFTSVIETYQVNSQIAASERAEVRLIEGSQAVTDKAAAVKVTLTDGRVDYIVYATNPNCTYEVDGKFTFTGFVGVCSYYDDVLVYAYGNEATQVADVIEEETTAVTGEILSFTEGLSLEGYTITVSMDQIVDPSDLAGRCIYVENDQQRNAVYQIESAQVNGDVAVLNIGHETLVRGYLDGTDLDRGFSYNIAKGGGYTIPLSADFNISDLLNYIADTVIKAGSKLNVTVGVASSGVRYEAAGLPSGAKFNATTGVMTWTPTSAQTGRYAITVYAKGTDGAVLGEMSFVIYVVAYTGSTFPAASCAHTKAVTFEADGMIETVCPACGTITKRKADQIEKFDLAGANMTLGNELKLNFLAKTADMTDGTYTAKITHNGEVTEEVFTRYNSGYQYVSYAVCAKQMADTITVEVFDENGNAVTEIYETSVRKYAMNLMGNSALGSKIKTLIVDMLNYGAEAQNYFSYNTKDLANSLLTDAQKALATASVACTNKQVKGENFYGANLSLEDRILLNVFFKNATEGMTAKVTYRDYAGTAKNITKELVQHSGNIYKVILDEIVLADAFSLVTVTVYNADGSIHGSGTDSVESYIARTGDSKLNAAIMKFAFSAKQYLS